MRKWLFTGISGSGRVELLDEIGKEARSRGAKVMIHDVGQLIRRECQRHKMPMVDERILDRDHSELRLLRAAALKSVEIETLKRADVDLHLIGVHATFRWKGRLIPGISYSDLVGLAPHGLVTVVHDVKDVYATNEKNKKWDTDTLPGLEETQNWMIEEEFVTEVLAEVLNVPRFLVARRHPVANLTDLLLTAKKRVYLSYPITAVKEDAPQLLTRIQGPILQELEKLFVVFNPLAIEDMSFALKASSVKMPNLLSKVNANAVELIKKRTIERDFQFIDQSDAIVVLYLTDKLSPGVLAEVFYAHRNQKPVFVALSGKKSPFLEDAATEIHGDVDALLESLAKYAQEATTQPPG